MSRKRRQQRRSTKPQLPANREATDDSVKPSDDDSAQTSDDLEAIVRREVSTFAQEVLVAEQELFLGPLPHPKHLAAYKEISPDIPERIVRMAEDQSEHRRKLESAIVESNLKLEVRGQMFGFVIAMSAVIGGVYLMANGQSLEGAATTISAVAGLVGLFFWVRHERKQELKKSKANAPVMTGDSSAPLSPPRPPQ